MFTIPGVNLTNGEWGRVLTLGPGFSAFSDLLVALMKSGTAFSVYDPLYPSFLDPGAYFSYRPSSGTWKMTLGNHGWSGGVYEVEAAVVGQQLRHLHASGLLDGLRLDGVSFFAHYRPESAEKNREMNQRLQSIHPPLDEPAP